MEGTDRPARMNGTHATSAAAGALHAGAPLTRPEREGLLRILLLGRGLERALAAARPDAKRSHSGSEEAILAAIAAAAGLAPTDRLVVPHGFLSAHLATGASLSEIAAARLGERRPSADADGRRLRAAIGPQSPVGIAVGVAFAVRHAAPRKAAVALIDRRWAEAPECRSALVLARELDLPLVVVAIDCGDSAESGAPVVNRREYEAVRAAVRAAISDAHADRGPSLVVCASNPDAGSPEHRVAPFRTEIADPVSAYERWLMIHGFSRNDLDRVRRDATHLLDEALGDRVAPARTGAR